MTLDVRVAALDHLADALQRVASGRTVLGLMAEGRTNAAIARSLVVADGAPLAIAAATIFMAPEDSSGPAFL